MKHVTDAEGHDHVELTSREVRQGRLGRPVLYVLLAGLAGTLLGFVLAGMIST
jgi:hypothetical protein